MSMESIHNFEEDRADVEAVDPREIDRVLSVLSDLIERVNSEAIRDSLEATCSEIARLVNDDDDEDEDEDDDLDDDDDDDDDLDDDDDFDDDDDDFDDEDDDLDDDDDDDFEDDYEEEDRLAA